MTNTNMLEKFINNEYHDALLFRNLVDIAKTKQERTYLEGIADDEARHVELFQEIYLQMTRRPFIPKIEPIRIVDTEYYEILAGQIGNKSENYRMYANEARRQDNPCFRNALNEAAIDENTHAHKLSELVDAHLLNMGTGTGIGTRTGTGTEQREVKNHETVLYAAMNKKCDKAQMYTQMQSAWEQHVWWTRSLIVSIANSLADRSAVTARLLQNPADIAKIYYQFYGKDTGAAVEALIAEHLEIGGEIIQAAKDGKPNTVAALEKKWYQNADDIVSALTKINPFYDKTMLQNMFYEHLKMTTDEVVQYLEGNYEKSIVVFDNIEKEALRMGNYLVDGIVNQFCK